MSCIILLHTFCPIKVFTILQYFRFGLNDMHLFDLKHLTNQCNASLDFEVSYEKRKRNVEKYVFVKYLNSNRLIKYHAF